MEPRRWACLGRAEHGSSTRWNPSPNPNYGAAVMRWVRALLKNASLAGAPKYIEHFSKFSPSPLSMKQFLDFGTKWVGGSWPRGPARAGVGRMQGSRPGRMNAAKRTPH